MTRKVTQNIDLKSTYIEMIKVKGLKTLFKVKKSELLH